MSIDQPAFRLNAMCSSTTTYVQGFRSNIVVMGRSGLAVARFRAQGLDWKGLLQGLSAL